MPRKIRKDTKVGGIQHRNEIKGKEDRYVAEHHEGSYGVTKREFMALLTKSAQPLKPDSKGIRTSEPHLSDDCTDKCTSQDKTVSKED
jgi:hypothetical protein